MNKEELVRRIYSDRYVNKYINKVKLLGTGNKIDVYDLIIKPKILNQSLSEKLYPQSALFSYKIIKNNGDTDPTIIYKIKSKKLMNYSM